MFYHLPPAGNPIVWKPETSSPDKFKSLVSPFELFFYSSGAQSLAVGVQTAIEFKTDIKFPEVLLPAYACPELVSAVLFAGAKPVLVDLELDRPWLKLDELEQKVSENTVAVIAVNLFGLPERLADIKQLADKNNFLLIEDSAQAFPESSDERFWQGDIVIMSFGRGKPVSLLGGGAVLSKNKDLLKILAEKELALAADGFINRLKYRLKIFLYNLLLRPQLYYFPNSMPWLKLGETRFKPMQVIEPADKQNISLLDNNAQSYLKYPRSETQEKISKILTENHFDNLLEQCSIHARPLNLIRFPVLVDNKAVRDKLCSLLSTAGLGASKMYQKPLNQIEGLEVLFENQGDFPNAIRFADKLITLPVHRGVSDKDVQKLAGILKDSGNR